MKFSRVREYALALADVTEEPHHHLTSFRVRGKIFATAPPEETHVHVFVSEMEREPALALYPEFVEKLFWGGKVQGLRIDLALAKPTVVKRLLGLAWQHKSAPLAAKRAKAPGISPS